MAGAVIHSIAAAGQSDRALELFDDLESGALETEITPDVACFNAKILALLKQKAWGEILGLKTEMISRGIVLNASTYQGMLISTLRMNQPEESLKLIEEAVETCPALDGAFFQQALRCLAPEIAGKGQRSLQDVRSRLRELGDNQASALRKEHLDLAKSLWAAVIEEERQESRNLRADDIAKRKQESWIAATRSLLDLAKAKRSTES